MTPIEAEQALYNDLLSIYARAGAEVSYETDKGEVKAYWPKRFLQAVKRAHRQGELFEFVNRLMLSDEPSRGFFILRKAGRLDLTVEALVCDRERPYYIDIDPSVVDVARDRLAGQGYRPGPARAASPTTGPGGEPGASTGAGAPAPGTSFDVRVTVGDGGELSLALL